MAALRGLRSPRPGKKGITIRRRVCEAVPPSFTWPGRYLSSGKASLGRPPVRSTGGIREQPVIFSDTFKKKGIGSTLFCLWRFHNGNKGNSKGFLESSLSRRRGLRSAAQQSPLASSCREVFSHNVTVAVLLLQYVCRSGSFVRVFILVKSFIVFW